MRVSSASTAVRQRSCASWSRARCWGAESLAKTVLLAGATGYIGSALARELLGGGYRLFCPVRSAVGEPARALRAFAATLKSPSLTFIETDPVDGPRLQADLERVHADAVVSCLGSRGGGIRDSEAVEYRANSNLLSWARDAGTTHFTLLSAICVQKPRLAFQFAKLRFEEALATSGLSHSIVRPTAYFKSLSGQLGRVRDGKAFLLFGNGELTRCKPIAEADLARYLRLTLEDQELRGVLPIGGPGPAISPREQAELLARLCGQEPRTRAVAPALLSGVAATLAIPGRIFPALADRAEFARIGHYYATESMLLWDEAAGRYDADATPEFGGITLEDSYRAQLAGEEEQGLGAQAVFDKSNTN